MKFKMIIKRRDMKGAGAVGYAIQIPELKMHIDLTPEHIQEILEDKHYDPFLEKLAINILEKKEEKEGVLITDRKMDSVLQEFYQDQKLPKENFDIPYEIDVEFKSKKQCRCCSRALPCSVKILIPIEIAAGTVLTISTLQWTQGTNKGVTITQVVAAAVFALCNIFIGPGMTFMKDFGTTIDATCQTAWRKLTCRKSPQPISFLAEQKPTPSVTFPLTLKIMLFTVALLGLNGMWVGMSQDYQQFKLLSEKAADDSGMSPLVFTIAVWTNFILNQPNDVLQSLSAVLVLFAVFKRMFIASKPASIESKTTSSDWIDPKKIDIRIDSNNPIDLLTSPITQAPVSQNGMFANTAEIKSSEAKTEAHAAANTGTSFPSDIIAYTPPVSHIGLLGSNNATFPTSKDDKHMLTQRLLNS